MGEGPGHGTRQGSAGGKCGQGDGEATPFHRHRPSALVSLTAEYGPAKRSGASSRAVGLKIGPGVGGRGGGQKDRHSGDLFGQGEEGRSLTAPTLVRRSTGVMDKANTDRPHVDWMPHLESPTV